LLESGSHQHVIENTATALLDRTQGWGAQGPMKASQNGGHMLYQYSMSEELLSTVQEWTFGSEALTGFPYQFEIMLYPMGGPVVEQVPEEAMPYGQRSAKLVLHYKHQWETSDLYEQAAMMRHHKGLSRALDAHLPCEGFYNYLDNWKTCARTNDEWNEAHFRDVDRMKRIKSAEDPSGVFRSRLTAPPAAPLPLDLPPLPPVHPGGPVPAPAPAPAPGPPTTTSPEVDSDTHCAAHPGCSGIGLHGICCPTVVGVMLDCCR
jgi:hypothetical protein